MGLSLIVLGIFVFVISIKNASTQATVWPGWYGLAILLGGVVLLSTAHMITRVTDKGVFVRFGVLPLFWVLRIPLSDVINFRSVLYPPPFSFSKHICAGRFEDTWCMFYRTVGFLGVLIETSKRRCIIGSQDPERFQAALEAALKGLAERV